MKILYGVQQPDEGTIAVDGETVTFTAPPTRSTRASAWCSSTSCWPTTSPSSRTSCSARRSCTASATRREGHRRDLRRLRPRVDPDVLVAELGVGERQRVEILKVLYRGAKILILDEPTAVLVPQEVNELFDNLRELSPRAYRHLHLPQARRGPVGRRRHHRDPARHHGRHVDPRRSRRSSPS